MPPSCISMGSCCANERSTEPSTDLDQEDWYVQQVYFDSLAYKTAVRKTDYERLQTRLKRVWEDYHPSQSSSLDKNKLDTSVRATLSPLLWKGVPYQLIQSVLSHLFTLDEGQAERQYEEAQSRARISQHLPAVQSTARLSAFLTPAGMAVVREIVQILGNEHPSIETRPYAQRVAQLLLWYTRPHTAFSILTEILPDPVYFPPTDTDYEALYAQVLKVILKTETSAREYFTPTQLQTIIKDMIPSLLIGYVRSEYFGCVLMVFLADGIKAIGKIAATLVISTVAAALAKVKWTVEENLKAEFMQLCLYGVDFLKIMEKAQSINFDSIEESEELIVKKTAFLPGSAIVSTQEEQERLLTYLPEDTESLHRLYQKSARVLGELYSTWQQCQEPQLLLIRIDKSTVFPTQSFGVYLDRGFDSFKSPSLPSSESMFIQVSPLLQGKRHVAPFSIRLSDLTDLEFVDENSEEPFLTLCQELKLGYQRASKAFNSEKMLEREEFRIQEVELFSVKRKGRSS